MNQNPQLSKNYENTTYQLSLHLVYLPPHSLTIKSMISNITINMGRQELLEPCFGIRWCFQKEAPQIIQEIFSHTECVLGCTEVSKLLRHRCRRPKLSKFRNGLDACVSNFAEDLNNRLNKSL